MVVKLVDNVAACIVAVGSSLVVTLAVTLEYEVAAVIVALDVLWISKAIRTNALQYGSDSVCLGAMEIVLPALGKAILLLSSRNIKR